MKPRKCNHFFFPEKLCILLMGKTLLPFSHPRMSVICSVRSYLKCLSWRTRSVCFIAQRRVYLMNSNRRSLRFVTRIGIAVVVVLALMVPLTALAYVATRDTNNSGIDNFQHVFVIMMENTSYTSLIGNPNAPFINSTATNYGLATNYFGVAHPSQPN